jgi:uncharacterized phage-like protein YoqJ
MKTLITGHRLYKLSTYNQEWIKEAIEVAISSMPNISIGLSGMASGVDLWFCQACYKCCIPFIACPPFEEQIETIPETEKPLREWCFEKAAETWKIRNSQMVVKCDSAIVVFDGNKGGTHNVFQQLVENKKPFIWINPVGEKIWECF